MVQMCPKSTMIIMYMKALYHALPMNYVTITKLQSKLEGEANQSIVRKLIDKMIQEGFVEATSNRRVGKRVIHFELTEKKLKEVKKALEIDPMVILIDFVCKIIKSSLHIDILFLVLILSAVKDLDMDESIKKPKHLDVPIMGNNQRDLSTCGALHSIGSDFTQENSLNCNRVICRRRPYKSLIRKFLQEIARWLDGMPIQDGILLEFNGTESLRFVIPLI